MMLRRLLLSSLCTVVAMMLAWTPYAIASPIEFINSGANAVAIQGTVDAFRTALGNPNNGNAAGTTGGRREINWDGGNVALTDTTPGGTPFNVFLNTRGGQFIAGAGGTGFVQAPQSVSGGGNGNGLAGLFNNASYGTGFAPFSPSRLFVPVGTNAFDALFFVPGTNGGTRATVSGFGIVFSDVDLANMTHIDFFDLQGNLLDSVNVPPGGAANQSFSFAGVLFTTEQIGRVHVVLGTNALAQGVSDGAGVDVVAMDDFLFSEPRAVSAPGVLTLLLTGAMVLGAATRLRRCGA